MSERAYSRFANTFMLIGVASALLFDSGRFPRALVGTVGVLSGVAAIALYFWNQLAVKKKERSAAKIKALSEHVVPGAVVQHGSPKRLTVAMDQAFEASLIDMTLHNRAPHAVMPRSYRKLWLSYDEDLQAIQAYRKETAKRRTLQWHKIKDADMALMKPEVELSPSEVAACATEIIRNLGLIEGVEAWDYTFGSKGLHVSMKRMKSARPVIPQEDFEFDFLNSLAI